jgi:hypothetical protein
LLDCAGADATHLAPPRAPLRQHAIEHALIVLPLVHRRPQPVTPRAQQLHRRRRRPKVHHACAVASPVSPAPAWSTNTRPHRQPSQPKPTPCGLCLGLPRYLAAHPVTASHTRCVACGHHVCVWVTRALHCEWRRGGSTCVKLALHAAGVPCGHAFCGLGVAFGAEAVGGDGEVRSGGRFVGVQQEPARVTQPNGV